MNYEKNNIQLNILENLGFSYVDSFLKYPESLKLYCEHTFSMFKDSTSYIDFLQNGSFDESSMSKQVGHLSIIMDDFDVASNCEKKDLEKLLGFYNYFSLNNPNNIYEGLSDMNDELFYQMQRISFMSGDIGIYDIGLDFNMMNSICDLSREVLKSDFELAANGFPLSTELLNQDLESICNYFPTLYKLIDEKSDRIVDYMENSKTL